MAGERERGLLTRDHLYMMQIAAIIRDIYIVCVLADIFLSFSSNCSSFYRAIVFFTGGVRVGASHGGMSLLWQELSSLYAFFSHFLIHFQLHDYTKKFYKKNAKERNLT